VKVAEKKLSLPQITTKSKNIKKKLEQKRRCTVSPMTPFYGLDVAFYSYRTLLILSTCMDVTALLAV